MDQEVIFWTIVGMGLVTYLPRLIPTILLSGRDLPPVIVSWLRLVPPAVLAAMLVPSLLVREQEINLYLDNLFLWAGVIAFAVAYRFKSLFLTVVVGMGLVAAGRFFGLGS